MRRNGLFGWIAVPGAAMIAAMSLSAAQATPVALFQTDGDSISDFDGLGLETLGNVQFGVSIAKLFGRSADAGNTPLASGDRFVNDFRDTLADGEFLASSSYVRHEASGIMFAMGAFDNPNHPAQSQFVSGLKFTIAIPEQIGAADRRLNLQFGLGQLAGGPAAIGGGPAQGRPQRKAVLRARIAGGAGRGVKVWGQFIENQNFDFNDADTNGNGMIDPAEEAALKRQLTERVIAAKLARKEITGADDPRLKKYFALIDRTKFVDPLESFYVDFISDSGGGFDLDVQIVFANDLFESLAQHLDAITIEIGEKLDFPELYDDIANDAFLGARPVGLDLGALGPGGKAGIIVGSVDIVQEVPAPASWLLSLSALAAFGLARRRRDRRRAARAAA